MDSPRSVAARTIVGLALLASLAGSSREQEAPPPANARILLMPRRLVTGERATLAVLDISGRLTPGVDVKFSDGEKVTTDATGRALFVAPLNPGTISAGIVGGNGRVSSTILGTTGVPSALEVVTGAPRFASLSDRFDLVGEGFCADADGNRVTVAGMPGLVLASSPAALTVLPPLDLQAGPAEVRLACGQKTARAFTIVFVSLELQAKSGTVAPGEHRSLAVRVRGTTARVALEARDLSADIADLTGGSIVRVMSSGGAENTAEFEVVGKKRGNFTISIRLISPLVEPRP